MREKADKKKKEGRAGGGPFLYILLVIMLGLFCFSGYRLVRMFLTYKAGVDEYNSIEEAYTSPADGQKGNAAGDKNEGEEPENKDSENKDSESKESGGKSSGDGQTEEMDFEDADPPLTVNFEELRKVNPEIVGWIYVDAFPETISYPILRGVDNDYYLHHTFKKASLYAGSIFENCENSADFTDPHTIIYGHNMKNRSMFGNLKFLKEQDRYDEHPYFWILTPNGSYRYRIFAAFDTPVSGSIYSLFTSRGKEFLEWEKEQQKASAVRNDVVLREDDFTVTLSTCTSNDSTRCVIVGKCVSSVRPDTYKKK